IGLAGGLRPQGYVHNPMDWVDPFGLVGCSSDAITLRKNMISSGKEEPPYPHAAHHNVMSNSTHPDVVATREHMECSGQLKLATSL
ncbi:hypothetical protein, partial [Motilimonas sp. E26]|uniref:hypothetical protein n=1 Tax=Motilimonas sp. E26 TaxID=2865674 RepID=UPI001E5F9FEE